MTNYELAENLKRRANNDPVFRKKLYALLLESSNTDLLKRPPTIDQLTKTLEELIMRDIHY